MAEVPGGLAGGQSGLPHCSEPLQQTDKPPSLEKIIHFVNILVGLLCSKLRCRALHWHGGTNHNSSSTTKSCWQ